MSHSDGVEITVIEDDNEQEVSVNVNPKRKSSKADDRIHLNGRILTEEERKSNKCYMCEWPPKYLSRSKKLVCELHCDENCRDFEDNPEMKLSYKYITRKKYQTLFRFYPERYSKEEQERILEEFDPDK